MVTSKLLILLVAACFQFSIPVHALVVGDSAKMVWGEIKSFDTNHITVQLQNKKRYEIPRSSVAKGTRIRAGQWISFFEKPIDVKEIAEFKFTK